MSTELTTMGHVSHGLSPMDEPCEGTGISFWSALGMGPRHTWPLPLWRGCLGHCKAVVKPQREANITEGEGAHRLGGSSPRLGSPLGLVSAEQASQGWAFLFFVAGTQGLSICMHLCAKKFFPNHNTAPGPNATEAPNHGNATPSPSGLGPHC